MNTKRMTYIALFTALICICAPISIPLPMSPVALTLGTFALYLAAYILEPKEALVATLLYLLLGAIGLPVFSGYAGGISRFVSAGGGYLVGYLVLVYGSSVAIHRFPKNRVLQLVGMFLSTCVTYMMGTFWMAKTMNTGFIATLPAGTFVFLPLDFVKMWIVCIIGQKIKKQVHYIKNEG